MNKFELKREFIKLRAMEYTYPNICVELNISKPTAIKWGKMYSEQINSVQKKILTNLFAEKIIEYEHGLVVNIREIKRLGNINPKNITENINNRIASKLEKIFLKRIVAVQIIMQKKSDQIDRAIFVFNDNVEVTKRPDTSEL